MTHPLGLVGLDGMPLLSDLERINRQEHLQRKAPDMGKNVPNSVADVHVQPPPEWEAALREFSPKTRVHSFLIFYWYRLHHTWVLYDGVPLELIDPDQPIAPGLMGRELLLLLEGPPPREAPSFAKQPWVSDAQHEMARIYGVYARPYWVLQGERGGHQYAYSPEQQHFLIQIGRDMSPPKIGTLAPCPFDNRAIVQLQRLNRLYQLNRDVGRLRQSGSSDAADVQQALVEREIRELSMRMLEQQMGEIGDMVATLGKHSEAEDSVIHAPGMAAKAKDAIAQYIETGEYVM
jgi:hypothetical protein